MSDIATGRASETLPQPGTEGPALSSPTRLAVNPGPDHEPDASSKVPRLALGTTLLGPYQGSGFATDHYLLRRRDGGMVLVSPIVYAAASRIDGNRTIADVAAQVSDDLGRRLDPTGLAYLIDQKLRPLGVVASEDGPEPAKVARPLLSLSLRFTLVPERAVGVLARLLAPFFFAPVVIAVLCGFVAVDVVLFAHRTLTGALVTVLTHPQLVAGTFGLFVVGMFFHELGHAAACRYGGGRPGRVGMGVYVLLPAFFTNVNDSYRLSRGARLRTDLGGLYFNAIFVISAGSVAWWTGSATALALTVLVQVGMLEQLLPLVRLDGYFVLSDLVGVPDLFGRIGPALRALRLRPKGATAPHQAALRPKVKLVVGAWIAIVFPALLFLLAMFVWHLPTFAQATWSEAQRDLTATGAAFDHHRFASLATCVVSLVLLTLPFAGMCVLTGRVLVSTGRGAARTLGLRPPSTRPKGRPDPGGLHFKSTEGAGMAWRKLGRSGWAAILVLLVLVVLYAAAIFERLK